MNIVLIKNSEDGKEELLHACWTSWLFWIRRTVVEGKLKWSFYRSHNSCRRREHPLFVMITQISNGILFSHHRLIVKYVVFLGEIFGYACIQSAILFFVVRLTRTIAVTIFKYVQKLNLFVAVIKFYSHFRSATTTVYI